MSILISCAFGLALFCLMLAVCVKRLKPTALATPQNIVEFSVARVARRTAPTSVPLLEDGSTGQFLRIEATSELKLPKLVLRVGPTYLPLGAPVAPQVRPFSLQQRAESPSTAAQRQNIACAR